MPIYHQAQHPLNKLFKDAKNGILMIPDLQREYVWEPMQIIRLIDTLLREWPYSTLLLWKTGLANNATELVPHHSFRRRISRLPNGILQANDAELPAAAVPGYITMVLDGQQRLQSLLLAFCEHDAGLNLLDKDWMKDISEDGDHPYRGPHVNSRWMFGQLFVDIKKLTESVVQGAMGGLHLKDNINYLELFRWACPADNRLGGHLRPETYDWPIDKLWEKNPGNGVNQYVHASKFWYAAEGFQSMGENDRFQTVSRMLQQQCAIENITQPDGTSAHSPESLKVCAGAIGLCLRLASVQQQMVGCLELSERAESGIVDDDQYNAAVVSIFTRLNAAGRTLEPEEITFAWLKSKWNDLRNNNPQLPRCDGVKIAEEIIENFKSIAKLTEPQAIRLLSHIWVAFNGHTRDYRLMSASDQLDGKTITEMATWLFQNWDNVKRSIKDVSDTLQKMLFVYGDHFRSVNAISPLIIYRFGILKILPNGGINGNWVAVNAEFGRDILKWLALSLFSGKWGRNSDEDLGSCVKVLGNSYANAGNLKNWRDVFRRYIVKVDTDKAIKYIKDLKPDGATYIKARPILAVWAHCNDCRREFSRNLADLNSPEKYGGTIDHISPQRPWSQRPVVEQNDEDVEDQIHQLGNLMELDSSSNSAKKIRTVNSWLAGQTDPNLLPNLKRAFEISEELCDLLPDTPENVRKISNAIDARTEKIRNDVIEFLTEWT
jgi:hypothetical protein